MSHGGGLLQGSDGDLYGTTSREASRSPCDAGCGAIFRVSPSGVSTTLHWFHQNIDGAYPSGGLVQGSDGDLYGSVFTELFKLSPSGTETGVFDDIATSLVRGSDSNIYGTSASVFFKIVPPGTATVVNAGFGNANWTLVQAADGNFYGTTLTGGTNGVGSVFQITPAGTVTTLYSFTGGADGATPCAGLTIGNDGLFYGPTAFGGSSNSNGTLFKITAQGTLTTIYNFTNSAGFTLDNNPPDGTSRSLVLGSDGNFYAASEGPGCGYLFQFTSAGTFTTLHVFDQNIDGCGPSALIQGIDGGFYGMLIGGVVFKLTMPFNSPPNQFYGIQTTGTNVLLSVPSVCGNTYQLQQSSSMSPANWVNQGPPVTSIGGPLTLTNLPGPMPPQAFFRAMIKTQSGQTVPVLAADYAADGAYLGSLTNINSNWIILDNGWTNNSNGWTGFGPWVFLTTSPGAANDGFFLGTSVSNAFNTAPGIDIGGPFWGINAYLPAQSWGIYANTGNTATAFRAFANGPIPVGGTFRVNLDTGFIDPSNSVGFALRNGNAAASPTDSVTGARFTLEYIGADPVNSYKVIDNGGQQNIGVGFTGTGLHLVFTLGTNDTYTVLTIDNATGSTNTHSGVLAGLAGSTLDSLALFNNNAGSGPTHDTFFNSLYLTGP